MIQEILTEAHWMSLLHDQGTPRHPSITMTQTTFCVGGATPPPSHTCHLTMDWETLMEGWQRLKVTLGGAMSTTTWVTSQHCLHAHNQQKLGLSPLVAIITATSCRSHNAPPDHILPAKFYMYGFLGHTPPLNTGCRSPPKLIRVPP